MPTTVNLRTGEVTRCAPDASGRITCITMRGGRSTARAEGERFAAATTVQDCKVSAKRPEKQDEPSYPAHWLPEVVARAARNADRLDATLDRPEPASRLPVPGQVITDL